MVLILHFQVHIVKHKNKKKRKKSYMINDRLINLKNNYKFTNIVIFVTKNRCHPVPKNTASTRRQQNVYVYVVIRYVKQYGIAIFEVMVKH